MKPTYTLIAYQNKPRIKVSFEYNAAWNKKMQAVAGAKWSKTLNSWHIPDTAENRGKCGLNPNNPNLAGRNEAVVNSNLQTTKPVLVSISNDNRVQLQRFLDQLKLKAYSPSTIKTYRNEFAQLLQAIGRFPVQNLKADDLKRYLLMCFEKGLTENTIHSRLNAFYPVGLKK